MSNYHNLPVCTKEPWPAVVKLSRDALIECSKCRRLLPVTINQAEAGAPVVCKPCAVKKKGKRK